MRGLTVKAHLTDFCDLPQGHGGEFNAQINDELTHIGRKVPRCLLWLFSGPGGEKTDHPLFVKGVSFSIKRPLCGPCFLCAFSRWIAKKDDGAQQLIRDLLWPQRILLNGLPIFGMFALDALAFGHRVPPHDRFAGASIVPRFLAFCKVFPSWGMSGHLLRHVSEPPDEVPVFAEGTARVAARHSTVAPFAGQQQLEKDQVGRVRPSQGKGAGLRRPWIDKEDSLFFPGKTSRSQGKGVASEGMWLSLAVTTGAWLGLRSGGIASIMHFTVRFFLRRNGSVPSRYIRFLDYASDRILLTKVGGGSMFVHRLLLEYFADVYAPLSPTASTSSVISEKSQQSQVIKRTRRAQSRRNRKRS